MDGTLTPSAPVSIRALTDLTVVWSVGPLDASGVG
jgi:hypothetical protein